MSAGSPVRRNQRSRTTWRTSHGNASSWAPNHAAAPSGTRRDGPEPDPRPSPKRVASRRIVRREPFRRVVGACVENRRGSEQPRLDRRTDAFAALRIREPDGVAREQHAIAGRATSPGPRQAVGVAAPPSRLQCTGWHHAARPKLGDKRRGCCRARTRIQAADADVHVTLLAKDPAVAFEVAGEVQLGGVCGRGELAGVLGRDRKLRFLRNDNGPARRACVSLGWSLELRRRVQQARDGTPVSSRANQDGRAGTVVDDPVAVLPPQTGDRRAEFQPRAGSAQQIVVELASPDAVADDAVVADESQRRASHDADAKSGDGLQRSPGAILPQVQLEIVNGLRGDPAGAHLVARKRGAIPDGHVETRPAKPPGTRRPCRSAADDDDVVALHVVSRVSRGVPARQAASRVQGIALLPPRANTI